MATTVTGHTAQKPSFAKVAASANKPKAISAAVVTPTAVKPANTPAPASTQQPSGPAALKAETVISQQQNLTRRTTILAKPMDGNNFVPGHQPRPVPNSNNPNHHLYSNGESQTQISNNRRSLADDSSTQASSSDGSAKPPSLDGKSVASGTTFALDEKESLRPDDSASLRAVEEEDGTSLPGSNAAGSHVGSDVGGQRGVAFGDQLREIAVLGPAHRGAPLGRFPPTPIAFGSAPYVSTQSLGASQVMPAQMDTIPPVTAIGHPNSPPDEKLFEALNSQRDRVWVLKLEQDLIDFVKDPRELDLNLPNCNSFYRMLAHKLADYYFLGHVVDETLKGVIITKTSYARIPPSLSSLAGPLIAHETAPLDLTTRKIMRRGDDSKGTSGNNTTANSESPSKATSEAGGANGSDVGQTSTKLTREEREARYNEVRQRIFANAEAQKATENGKAEDENGNSRSSSSSGKKSKKKQRNYNDDEFEARSSFNAYYPQAYGTTAYSSDGTPQMYSQYGQPVMMQQQYSMMQASGMTSSYSNGSYASMTPDMSQQFQWQSPQFQPPMATPYGVQPPMQYDLSADFQQRMQFQSPSFMGNQMHMQQPTPPMMANSSDGYRPPSQSYNQAWPGMSPHSGFPSPNQFGSANGSPSMSSQSAFPQTTPYAYGQLPAANVGNSKGNRNQHPVPGSYNRNQFNPQSQAFVPGAARPNPYPMQNPTLPMMQSQHQNGYGQIGFPMQAPNQMAHPMSRTNSQNQHQPPPAFHSPMMNQHGPVLPKVNNQVKSNHLPQQNTTSPLPQPHMQPIHSQTSPQPGSLQSSIAKWGNSSLPPKPPAPVSMQPAKFSSPTPNLPAPARMAPINGNTGQRS